MAKIGIFGGTFDPVHIGHLRVAQEFAAALELDRVLMMVAATPPHRDPPVASPEDRLAMVKIAVRDIPCLEASDLELTRSGPSYTIDTVDKVRSMAGGAMVWMALGFDAFELLGTWHRPEEVLERAHVVVLTRPGYPVDLVGPLPRDVSDSYTERGDILVHRSGATLRALQVSSIDVSSSMVRKTLSEGGNAAELVTDGVLKYIMQKGLYRSPARPKED